MFCMVVLGFIGASEMIGVTSFCRFWCLNTTGYYAFLHFFRSSTWSLDKVTEYWNRFVLSQNETVKSNGRVVLQADHTYVPEDGRQMPCVATLHQHSETQSKPSYFRGHCWGAIGILIGSMAPPFCTPLSLQIHQGLIHVNDDDNIEDSTETLGTRIVQMAIDFAMKHSVYCILTLDAFSPSASVFKLAGSVLCVWHQVPLITLIIRAKKNCVAYFEAQTQQKKGPGRPPKYGEKVRLSDLFDHQHLFSKIECTIYGKVEEISITSRDLLWKPTAGLVRFVLAITSRGPNYIDVQSSESRSCCCP